MRIDLFLTRTHLLKRRTLAQELTAGGRVSLNGQPAKAGKNTAVGDHLLILFPRRELLIEILDLPKRKYSAKEGASLYKILEDKKVNPATDWD